MAYEEEKIPVIDLDNAEAEIVDLDAMEGKARPRPLPPRKPKPSPIPPKKPTAPQLPYSMTNKDVASMMGVKGSVKTTPIDEARQILQRPSRKEISVPEITPPPSIFGDQGQIEYGKDFMSDSPFAGMRSPEQEKETFELKTREGERRQRVKTADMVKQQANAPSYGEQLANRFGRGYIGSSESSLRGVALINPNAATDPTTEFLFQTPEENRARMQGWLPVNEYDKDFFLKASESVGSSVPFMISGAAGGAAGLPGWMMSSLLGAASNAGGTYQDAISKGADDQTARYGAIVGALIGLGEGLGVGSLGIKSPAGLPFMEALRKRLMAGGKELSKEAIEEWAQETGSQILNNVNAKVISGYDPTRAIQEEVWDSGLMGLFTGGAMAGGFKVGGAIAISRDPTYREAKGQYNTIMAVDKAFKDFLRSEEEQKNAAVIPSMAPKPTTLSNLPVPGQPVQMELPYEPPKPPGRKIPQSTKMQPLADFGMMSQGDSIVAQRERNLDAFLEDSQVQADLYHGTPQAIDIGKIDYSMQNPDSLYGPGFYMTQSPDVAAREGASYAVQPAPPITGQAAQQLPQFQERLDQEVQKRIADSENPESVNYNLRKSMGDKKFNFIVTSNAKAKVIHDLIQESKEGSPHAYKLKAKITKPFDIDAPISREEMDRVSTMAIEQGAEPFAAYLPERDTGHFFYRQLQSAFKGDRAKVNKVLQDAGYDGITHIGGRDTNQKTFDDPIEASRYAKQIGGSLEEIKPDVVEITTPDFQTFYRVEKPVLNADPLDSGYARDDNGKIIEFPTREEAEAYSSYLASRYDVTGHKVWIAFPNASIKSATGNVGTFDVSNPDLSRSLGKPVMEGQEYDASNDPFAFDVIPPLGGGRGSAPYLRVPDWAADIIFGDKRTGGINLHKYQYGPLVGELQTKAPSPEHARVAIAALQDLMQQTEEAGLDHISIVRGRGPVEQGQYTGAHEVFHTAQREGLAPSLSWVRAHPLLNKIIDVPGLQEHFFPGMSRDQALQNLSMELPAYTVQKALNSLGVYEDGQPVVSSAEGIDYMMDYYTHILEEYGQAGLKKLRSITRLDASMEEALNVAESMWEGWQNEIKEKPDLEPKSTIYEDHNAKAATGEGVALAARMLTNALGPGDVSKGDIVRRRGEKHKAKVTQISEDGVVVEFVEGPQRGQNDEISWPNLVRTKHYQQEKSATRQQIAENPVIVPTDLFGEEKAREREVKRYGQIASELALPPVPPGHTRIYGTDSLDIFTSDLEKVALPATEQEDNYLTYLDVPSTELYSDYRIGDTSFKLPFEMIANAKPVAVPWQNFPREWIPRQSELPGMEGGRSDLAGVPPILPPEQMNLFEDMPEFPPILEDRVTNDYTKPMARAYMKLLERGGIKHDPTVHIYRQILDALDSGKIRGEDFDQALEENGLTLDQFKDHYANTVAASARTLQELSRISYRYNKLFKRNPELAAKLLGSRDQFKAMVQEIEATTLGQNAWQRGGSLIRILMLSELRSAAVNAMVSLGRIPLVIATQGLGGFMYKYAINRASGASLTDAMKTGLTNARGNMQIGIDVLMAMNPVDVAQTFRMKKGKHAEAEQIIQQLIHVFPELKYKLLAPGIGVDYSPTEFADKMDAARNLIMKMKTQDVRKESLKDLEKFEKRFNSHQTGIHAAITGVEKEMHLDWLMAPMKWQEMLFRRPMFVAYLSRALEKRGMDMKTMVAQNANRTEEQLASENSFTNVPQDVLDEAVGEALDFTYSYMPEKDGNIFEKAGYYMVNGLNQLAPLSALIGGIAFPRALYNGMKFLYEYSPAAMVGFYAKKFNPQKVKDPLTQTEYTLNGLTEKDYVGMAKGMVGTVMFYLAAELIRSGMIGDEWWKLKVPFKKSKNGNPEFLDIRRYQPLSTFVRIADIFMRTFHVSGRGMEDFKPGSELLEAVTGFRDFPGVIDLIDATADMWNDDTEGAVSKAATSVGMGMSWMSRPFMNLRDAVAIFSDEEQKQRDVKGTGFWGPVFDNIPWVRRMLDEKKSPVHPNPEIGALSPLESTWTRTALAPLAMATGLKLVEGENFAGREWRRLGIYDKSFIPPDSNPSVNRDQSEFIREILDPISKEAEESEAYAQLPDAEKAMFWELILTTGNPSIVAGGNMIGLAKNPKEATKRGVKGSIDLGRFAQKALHLRPKDILQEEPKPTPTPAPPSFLGK